MPKPKDLIAQNPSQTAVHTLCDDLTKAIQEKGTRLVDRDGQLNRAEIFAWLHHDEQERDTVLRAAQDTDGSVWGLACLLAEALQPSVDSAQEERYLESVVKNMTHVHLFRNMMNFWLVQDAFYEQDLLCGGSMQDIRRQKQIRNNLA